ncbi:MAG: hypothetical protein GYB58_14810 [Gammaproteobacteria bacterium]|nr:hypothetical protein [Gammaproteobacteria bacterium]
MTKITREVRIKMELEFSEFKEQKRKKFLSELSQISGVPLEEIIVTRFNKGCVIFYGELDREAVERLVELFENLQNLGSELYSQEFRDFLKHWDITSITQNIDSHCESQQEKQNNVRDLVLFVHGWNGSLKSWGELPNFIGELVECKTALYEYPTGVWDNSPSLEFIARNLDNWVRANYRNFSKISIVAHSMGGILVRRLATLQKNRRKKLDNIVQVTFIASPHNGAVLAKLATSIPTLEKLQLQELSADSPFIFSLNSDWLDWVESGAINRENIRCIVGTNDKVVSVNNAMGLDAYAVPLLGEDHINIVKPKDKNSEVVVTLQMFLEDAAFKIKETDL